MVASLRILYSQGLDHHVFDPFIDIFSLELCPWLLLTSEQRFLDDILEEYFILLNYGDNII